MNFNASWSSMAPKGNALSLAPLRGPQLHFAQRDRPGRWRGFLLVLAVDTVLAAPQSPDRQPDRTPRGKSHLAATPGEQRVGVAAGPRTALPIGTQLAER